MVVNAFTTQYERMKFQDANYCSLKDIAQKDGRIVELHKDIAHKDRHSVGFGLLWGYYMQSQC